MLRSPTLTSLLDQHAYNLRTQLDSVYDGGVEAVHDARVATRRIRELLALVPAVPGRDDEAETTKGFKQMGRALGRVRDIDVQIGLIRNLEDHAPHTAPSLVLVRREREAARLAKTRRLIKTLERIDAPHLLSMISNGHPLGLRRRLVTAGWRQQLRHLLVERSRTAVEAITHATGIYFPRRAHGARIAIKQLRYAAEMAQATGLLELQDAVRTLRKGQEILGDLHDRQTLADSLQGYGKDDGVEREHRELARQVLEGEVLQLHADYIARRSALRQACVSLDRTASSHWPSASAISIGAALAISGLALRRRARMEA